MFRSIFSFSRKFYRIFSHISPQPNSKLYKIPRIHPRALISGAAGGAGQLPKVRGSLILVANIFLFTWANSFQHISITVSSIFNKWFSRGVRHHLRNGRNGTDIMLMPWYNIQWKIPKKFVQILSELMAFLAIMLLSCNPRD